MNFLLLSDKFELVYTKYKLFDIPRLYPVEIDNQRGNAALCSLF